MRSEQEIKHKIMECNLEKALLPDDDLKRFACEVAVKALRWVLSKSTSITEETESIKWM